MTDGNGMAARMANLEGRLDRFETRVERELANGSRVFIRRETFEPFEREIRSDLNDLRAEVAAMRNEAKQAQAEQRASARALRNLVLAALLSALLSGVVSLIVLRAGA